MPAGNASRSGRWLAGLAVVHPFPSALNAIVVLMLALLAGAQPVTASALAAAMLGLQFCIGATNDLLDESLDAVAKPAKPIPAGLVSRPTATAIALVSGGGGLTLAAAHGPVVFTMAALMLSAGLTYNLFLKRGPFSWLAYAVALPVLPLYAWWGAASMLPPRAELLVPLAALAGPALQLANGIVDDERDRAAGALSLAVVLGRPRALALTIILQATIHGSAWLSLTSAGGRDALALGTVALATSTAAAGLILSASRSETRRERGWQAQAVSVGLLALGWLAAAGRA